MKKILIINNDPHSIHLLKASLDKEFQILETSCKENALTLARAHRPDLILLDLNVSMKRIEELVACLRGANQTRFVPIILLSSKEQEKDILRGLHAGADDYVTWPIDATELETRVYMHLRTKNYYKDLDRTDLLMLLEMTEVVSVTRNPKRILKTIVDKMAQDTEVSRCSIISLTDEGELVVLASSDLSDGQEIKLDLHKYPEIRKALVTQRPVVLQDISSSPLMASVKDKVEFLTEKAVLVVPIIKKKNVIGTFFIRAGSLFKGGITERVFKLCQIVANTMGNAIENAVVFKEMQNTKELFEERAIRDSLTRLYNHQHFHLRFHEEFSRAQRYDQPLSCVFLDIDNFKAINDKFGHIWGDVVLKKIGRIIEKLLRKSDIAARYGGEEFAALLPNTNYDGASEFADRLLSEVRELNIPQLKGRKITISIGLSTFQENNVTSYETLLQLADEAMYQAKKSGKDRMCHAVIAA
jgi:two-component system cell cycle response regulator